MSTRWEQIEPALDALLLAPSSERDRLLDQLTADDAGLRAELESLLSAHASAEDFLETPAAFLLGGDDRWASEAQGQLIGRYRLIEPIGRGGMGTVWMAERSDGAFDQRVALKLIKRGMDTDEVIARFRRERQIMARLEHPNIARLLDGGVSADGRSYLVMEYVDGVSISKYCDERKLSVDERLRIFETVCRAVQYAHGRLVVHRDLKPSNILVTSDGEVKLLDFGIAKILEDDRDDTTMTAWSRPFTPEYATPEQVTGETITTSSDVYQLGIVLYELLAGSRPFRFDRHDLSDVRSTILGNEPAPPSTMAKRLHADLDAIVLAALRKEPERRYATVDALADDIQRYRSGRAVSVRGDNARYRLAKFLRRNRARLTTALAFVLVAIGFGTAYTIRLRADRDRALREAVKAGRTAEFFGRFFEDWNPDVAHAGKLTSADLLEDAVRQAEREFSNQPEIESSMLSLASAFFTSIGRYERADSLSSRALATQRRLYAGDHPDLAATLTRRGKLLTLIGRFSEADSVLSEGLRMNRALFGNRHRESLRTEQELAWLLSATDRPKDAEVLLREVSRFSNDSSSAAAVFRAEVQSRLGYAVFQQSRYQEARELIESALAEQRHLLGDVHVSTVWTVRVLASLLRDVGELDRSETLYREALASSRLLFGDDHFQTETSEYLLILQLQRTGKFAEAERLSRAGLPRLTRRYGERDPRAEGWRGRLATILLDNGATAEAETLLRSTLDDYHRLYPGGHQDEMDWANRLAYITMLRGAPDADQMYRTALALRARKPADQPDFVTDGVHFLAWAMNAHGDVAESKALYQSVLALYRRVLPSNHPYVVFAQRGLDGIRTR